MAKTYVPRHPWSLGKTGYHPGYYRTERKSGKKMIVGKQYTFKEVRDENGEFRGWKRVIRR